MHDTNLGLELQSCGLVVNTPLLNLLILSPFILPTCYNASCLINSILIYIVMLDKDALACVNLYLVQASH